MSILDIPIELLLDIAKYLGPKSLSALLLANRYFAAVLTPLLHKLALEGEDGESALCWAVRRGHEPLVKLLLEKGVDINAPDGWVDSTALHEAVKHGYENIVSILLEKGANVDPVETNYYTPLFYAIEYENEPIVKMLLERGADMNLEGSQDSPNYRPGPTALQLAHSDRHYNILKLLLQQAKIRGQTMGIHCQNWEGRGTALHEAARAGSEGIVRLLLENGASVQIYDSEGNSPLHHAAATGCEGVVRLILAEGAEVDDLDRYKSWTPLHLAIKFGNVGAAKLLLEHGANIEQDTYYGMTPLFLARLLQHDEMIELLLDKGEQ